MSMKTFDNIWDAISDTPEEAENMKVRAQLMNSINNWIARHKLSQADAAKALGVSQPRISELVNGKISFFSVDKLITMMAHAGMHIVNIEISETAAA
ncbi:helix-turn-helix domain-containing protein [Pantoea cypripedii]|jgi:predicted XRE-type DNA-binding protein|uniref:Transcriptional regulator n=1 Tax=Pantoea cypripedii TaxID=55209 RepID=A0A6B9G648_PANCY|nr:XRE family transcriptional regulator [Pantoea cypripedii]QGY32548.1 transcriptional regulator [Pantoea cypripedii]